ncbi:MAG TPA: hypothetical protein PLR64_03825, partial [Candidatus Dojkabacteria bacterium]|nr:hypothetical protein [Candidatus Dojkabacteria bacterium]
SKTRGENMDEWNIGETYKIFVNGEEVTSKTEPITAEEVRSAAREVGIKTMSVTDTEDVKLLPGDFPFSGDVKITQVNKAG